MKKAASFIFIAAIVLVLAPMRALAATITTLNTTTSSSSFAVQFKLTGQPQATTPIYAWIARETGGSQWIKQDIYLMQIAPTDPTPITFSVDFKFNDLGLQPGITYSYLLADATGMPAHFLNYVACFTTTGPTTCPAVTAESNGDEFPYPGPGGGTSPTSGTGGGSPTSGGTQGTGGSQGAGTQGSGNATAPGTATTPAPLDPSHPTVNSHARNMSDATFDLYVNLPQTTENDAAFKLVFRRKNHMVMPPATLKLFYGIKDATGVHLDTERTVHNGTFNSDYNHVTEFSIGGLEPHTKYFYEFRETTTNKKYGVNSFETDSPANTYTAGGISVTFPPDNQVITSNSAEIHGTVYSLVTVPIELSVLSGVAGSPLGNEKPLFSATMLPGQSKPITVTLSGLVAGETYYFAIKNAVTGTVTSPLYFTTPGGALNQVAKFAGHAVGGTGAPDDITIEDSISDSGIVPKCGRTAGPNVSDINETRMCGYKDFIQLVANVINYALLLLGPIIAIYAMYLGVMIIIEGKAKDPTSAMMKRLEDHKKQLGRIVIAVIIILFAWTLIATIIRELGVKPNYVLLDVFQGN
jgi:hypothetical protein